MITKTFDVKKDVKTINTEFIQTNALFLMQPHSHTFFSL